MQLISLDIPNQLVQQIGSTLKKKNQWWQVQITRQLHIIMNQLQSIHGKTNNKEQVGEHLEVAAEILVLKELANNQQQLFIEVFHKAYALLENIPNIEDKAQNLAQKTMKSHDDLNNDYIQNAVSLFSTFMGEE